MAEEEVDTSGNELDAMYGKAPGLDELASETADPGSTEGNTEETEEEESQEETKDKGSDKPAKQQELPGDILDDTPIEKTGEGDGDIEAEVEKEFEIPEDGAEKDVTAMRSMRERIVELRKENQTLKSGGDEALQTQLAEANARLEKADYAQSPKFQAEHVQPANATWEQIANIAKAYELSPDSLQAAARADVKERDAILTGEGIPQAGLVQLLPLFNQFTSQMNAAQAALESFTAKTAEEAEQESKMMEEAATTALNGAISTLQADNHFLLRESKQNPEWFPGVVEGAREMMAGGFSPSELAEAAIKAQLADHYKNFYLSQTQKLKEEISALQASQGIEQTYKPKIDSSAAPIKKTEKKETAMSLDELAEETVGAV